jgi:hypothetical protein
MTTPLLCQYSDIFGTPNQGVHSSRFLGMAAVDLFGTLAIALIISYLTAINPLTTFAILMILATALHALFCVDTAIIKTIKNTFLAQSYDNSRTLANPISSTS